MQTLSRQLTLTLVMTLVSPSVPRLHGQGLPPPPEHSDTGKPSAPGPTYISFDVASIREHKEGDGNSSWQTKPNGISMSNMHLDSLLGSAYRVKQDLITGGPAWITVKGWDIEAKVLPQDSGTPVKLTDAQQRSLLRALLEDRFNIKAHIEAKTLPVYDLVVAKSGPKLQVAPPPPPDPDAEPGDDERDNGTMSMNDGHMEMKSYRIAPFAEMLGYTVQRTVINRTGLTGRYDFTLDFTPEQEAPSASNATAAGTEAHPPIFTAIQEQLGLKLVPTKCPVDTLVIDNGELPSAN